jgi:hypothetical protein
MLQFGIVQLMSALLALSETDSTSSTLASVLLRREARLEAAIVATMKLRIEVASIMNANSGSALALVNSFH